MLVPPLSSDIGAKNSRLGDRIRKVAAGPRLCKLFCGGAACKYCDHKRWIKANQAVEGASRQGRRRMGHEGWRGVVTCKAHLALAFSNAASFFFFFFFFFFFLLQACSPRGSRRIFLQQAG